MIFSTNSFYKTLVAFPVVGGIGLLIFGLQDFSEATDEQKKSIFLTLMMLLIFFFGVSLIAMRDLKKSKETTEYGS